MTALYTSFRYRLPNNAFEPVADGLLNFYQAGTTTPVTVYSDAALTIPLSNPVEADGFGLFPDIFLAVDDYRIVATDSNAVQIWETDDFSVTENSILSSNYFDLIGGEYFPAIASNNQTGTGYAITDADRAALITLSNGAGGTITIAAPSGSNFPNKWFCYVSNRGTGTFTITSPANINGAASVSLAPGSFTLIVSTGSTYFAGASQGSAAANTVIANATGSVGVPGPFAMGPSTILARLAAGNIVAATPTQINTLLNIPLTLIPDAICSYNGTGTPAFISNSGFTSITDNGTGDWTLNSSLITTNSIIQVSMDGYNGGASAFIFMRGAPAAGTIRISNKIDDGGQYDSPYVTVTLWNLT